jgi:hypothetical protein
MNGGPATHVNPATALEETPARALVTTRTRDARPSLQDPKRARHETHLSGAAPVIKSRTILGFVPNSIPDARLTRCEQIGDELFVVYRLDWE